MRRVDHPGPIAPERRLTADCALAQADLTLPPGASLLETMSAVLDSRGAQSAVASLRGGAFDPFVFVMPALSPSSAHAVYFSNRHEPRGRVRLETANVTLGRKDGQPWLHCHGTWRDRDGNRLGGHVLPNEALISQAIEASIWFMDGAVFDVRPSPETAFTLFEPTVSVPLAADTSGVFAMVVRANEDLCTAVEAECRERGIQRARIRGGVGSLVGTQFSDGREVIPFVTEVFISNGSIATDARGTLVAELDVCVIDYLGGLSEGRLQRGANPVLVTFEFVIEPLAFH